MPMEKLRRGTATAMASLSWFGGVLSAKAAEINQNSMVNGVTTQISTSVTKAKESDAYNTMSTGATNVCGGMMVVGDTISKGAVAGIESIKTNTGPVLETIGAKSTEAFVSDTADTEPQATDSASHGQAHAART